MRSGQIEPVVRDLLLSHYDPVYVQSMERNFAHYAQAQTISPRDRSTQSMLTLANELVARLDSEAAA